jgi:iron complex transport system ATP-binding protein
VSSLSVRDLSARYHRTTVLSGVSTTVDSGGWLGIIGPNGSGKSTLLKAVLGLVRHEGTVLVDGSAISALPPRNRARRIAYAPQTPQLPVGLTVSDYVLLGRTPHLSPLGREGKADLAVMADSLARLDLTHLAGRALATLSGGERQRAVLARAIGQQAGVLLLDEPTTGLDVGHAQALLDVVDELRREHGTTVVTPANVLTPATLAERYGARVTVLRSPDGSPVIAPVRDPGS